MCVTGNMGEVESIRCRVSNKADCKVSLAGFRQSRSGNVEEPPIENVLKTNFWTSPLYEPLRTRLAKPVPTLTILQGGGYVTINTQTGTTTVSEEFESAEESQVCCPSLSLVSLHACQ